MLTERKRDYTHIQSYEKEIIAMLEEGKTQKDIAEILGFRDKYVVKHFLKRQRDKKRKIQTCKPPRRRGRPRKTPLTTGHEMGLRIKELEREVELYKSFLHAAGRM